MPFVTVLGLPSNMLTDEIQDLESDLQSAVCGVKELKLVGKEDHVTVILIPGLSYPGQKRNIKVLTSGLRDEPERTPEVHKLVAGATGRVLDQHFPDAYVASDVGEPYDYNTKPFWDNED